MNGVNSKGMATKQFLAAKILIFNFHKNTFKTVLKISYAY